MNNRGFVPVGLLVVIALQFLVGALVNATKIKREQELKQCHGIEQELKDQNAILRVKASTPQIIYHEVK